MADREAAELEKRRMAEELRLAGERAKVSPPHPRGTQFGVHSEGIFARDTLYGRTS